MKRRVLLSFLVAILTAGTIASAVLASVPHSKLSLRFIRAYELPPVECWAVNPRNDEILFARRNPLKTSSVDIFCAELSSPSHAHKLFFAATVYSLAWAQSGRKAVFCTSRGTFMAFRTKPRRAWRIKALHAVWREAQFSRDDSFLAGVATAANGDKKYIDLMPLETQGPVTPIRAKAASGRLNQNTTLVPVSNHRLSLVGTGLTVGRDGILQRGPVVGTSSMYDFTIAPRRTNWIIDIQQPYSPQGKYDIMTVNRTSLNGLDLVSKARIRIPWPKHERILSAAPADKAIYLTLEKDDDSEFTVIRKYILTTLAK